jgi:hypothetical protein
MSPWTRVLKQEMKYTTPIVALTAETGSDVRERCRVGHAAFWVILLI